MKRDKLKKPDRPNRPERPDRRERPDKEAAPFDLNYTKNIREYSLRVDTVS